MSLYVEKIKCQAKTIYNICFVKLSNVFFNSLTRFSIWIMVLDKTIRYYSAAPCFGVQIVKIYLVRDVGYIIHYLGKYEMFIFLAGDRSETKYNNTLKSIMADNERLNYNIYCIVSYAYHIYFLLIRDYVKCNVCSLRVT